MTARFIVALLLYVQTEALAWRYDRAAIGLCFFGPGARREYVAGYTSQHVVTASDEWEGLRDWSEALLLRTANYLRIHS